MAYSQTKGSDITITIKKELKSKSYLSPKGKISKTNDSFSNILKIKAIADSIETLETATQYYFINRNLSLEDNYQGQRDLNIAKQFLGYAQNIGKAALLGYATGGVELGVVAVGAGATAGVTAVVAVAGIAVNAGIALNKQDIKIMQLNRQLEFSREKVGYSLTMGAKGTNL